jgi:predicted deacylase
MGRTGRDTDIFVANSVHVILSTSGGFVELLVNLNDKVEVGQKVAIQRNTFGEVVAEYTSEVTGEVAVRRTDATAEPGTLLLAILYNRTPLESTPYPE